MARLTLTSPPRRVATTGLVPNSAYDAGDTLRQEIAGWRPNLEPADGELSHERDDIRARSRDLIRNNGWAAGAVVKEVDAVLGANFRPASKPDWRALGVSPEDAQALAREIEAAWRSYANDPRFVCDATRTMTMGGLFGLAYRHYLGDGDALAVLHWEEARPWSTVLRVVDPDLLTNPNDMFDSEIMRGGVEIDAHGAALAYHFRQGHPMAPWATVDAYRWERVARETEWGRPQVVHFFDKHRDGQSRGVSRLTPIAEKLKMEDKYSRVELQAAVLNAVLGAFIESPLDPDMFADSLNAGEISGYQEARADFHKQRQITLGGVQLPTLFPGERVGFHVAQRPAAQFGEFETAVLRHIAAGIGVSYEQLSADWSKTNYSSARAALIEIWRGWTSRRQAFAQRFCQPVYAAFLEEAIDRGLVFLPRGWPDFYEALPAYTAAKWIGPGKGFVDPVKEIEAAALRVKLGVSTLEDEAAELTGSDYEENMAQIEREIAGMPEGMIHPAQEKFSELIGRPPPSPDRQ